MKTDTLGRRYRTVPTPTGINLTVTEKDLKMLLALQLHGLLPTNLLAKYHGNRLVYTQERLTQLTHEKPKGYSQLIFRPPQQEQTKYYLSNFNFYQLTKAGRKWLDDNSHTVDTIKPSGGFVHMAMIASVTASIELQAREMGIEFIPGHVILDRAGATLGWEKTLTPDQLFALKYPNGTFMAFAVECDRGTEQVSFSDHRKTYEGNYRHYKRFVGEKLYKDHYGLNCPLKVLNVMNSGARMASYMNLITKSSYMLFQTIDGFGTSFRSPKFMPQLLTGEWLRSGYETAIISGEKTAPEGA